jgi:hypothetical protein
MIASKTLHGGDVDSDLNEAVQDLESDLNRCGERSGSLRDDRLIGRMKGTMERLPTGFGEAGEDPF